MNGKSKNDLTPAQTKALRKKFREIANGDFEIDGSKPKKRAFGSCGTHNISKDMFAAFYNTLFSVTVARREQKCFKE